MTKFVVNTYNPTQVVTEVESYVRQVSLTSPVAQLAISACWVHGVNPMNWGHNGMENWRAKIMATILEDLLLQMSKTS
jgi:hypothetical protein